MISILVAFATYWFSGIKDLEKRESQFWKSAVGYWLDVFDFKDSSGDFVGDLTGLISEVDYIKSIIGAGYVILGPITKGFYTNRYKVIGLVEDYKELDNAVGTVEDFRHLIREFHKQDLKIILTLDFNSVSTRHNWVIQNEAKLVKYPKNLDVMYNQMSISHTELSPFTSQWINRKLYTLMFVIYSPNASSKEYPMVMDNSGSEIYTDEMCTDDTKSWLLLGLKQRGFGKGRWNGFGGKVQSDDTNPKTAALRELEEESGLVIKESAVDEVGRLWFTFTETLECMEVYVFVCRMWTPTLCGDTAKWPCYTEEMHPAWFPLVKNKDNVLSISYLPLKHMWPDDSLWLPHILQENLVLGWFHFTRISHQSIVPSQNLTDCSIETDGLCIDPYEIPAYHMELFADEHDSSSSNGEKDFKCSSIQQIIDHLNIDKCDDNLRLWMNSSLYQVYDKSSCLPIKVIHYPLDENIIFNQNIHKINTNDTREKRMK
ncbi:unnamed protein product [Heterobilharzia americana]|nr:unnamed protein product [Heterobilharzia americana]